MKQLQKKFKKNGLGYVIIERTDSRYLAELHSEESGGIVAYETGRIMNSKEGEAEIGGKKVFFQAKEVIPNNEAFGKYKFEGCFSPKNINIAREHFTDGVNHDLQAIQPDSSSKQPYSKQENILMV